MARNNALNFNLPSVDDLFSTEESRAEARLEKVVNLNPSEISDFPDHPYRSGTWNPKSVFPAVFAGRQYGAQAHLLSRPHGLFLLSGENRGIQKRIIYGSGVEFLRRFYISKPSNTKKS